ncbi:hypothetical protein L596_014338 [Steinernema carpocapsae]|uniref:Chitin-binding type-2 domain-containing protein n=1 Tax=Steinernema carpocapsae TaxID=34508 RepID=A0A4U5NCK4_STECR|nr:hypothetical protein L596_014338 [Steinernema carpocapsae]
MDRIKMRIFLALFLFVACTHCKGGEEFLKPLADPTPLDDETVSGRLCMTVEMFKPSADPTAFFECAPFSDEEVREYELEDKYLGVWSLRDCPQGFEFDEVKQRCVEKKKLRRQQAMCSQNPGSVGCGQVCNGNRIRFRASLNPLFLAPNVNPQVGSSCNWITATLMADPLSQQYFFQCSPVNPNAACGEWVRMPCNPGTVFNPTTQICVAQSVSLQSCGVSTIPVCSCAQRPSMNVCPGTATCQQNVCCQAVQSPLMIQSHPGLCIGTGVAPVASCNYPCPPSTQCQPNIGCCPMAAVHGLPPPMPIPMIPGEMVTCPNGSPAGMQCGALNQCPPNMGCFQGACCPMSCPSGQNPSGFCANGGCSNGGSCYQPAGCCCAALEPVRLPICSNGQSSTIPCNSNGQCPPAMECSSGGCCPRGFCPSGIQSTGRCVLGNGCAPGSLCIDNQCCPLPQCPSGQLAARMCQRSADCGMGMECAGGGCCPLPMCPTGGSALSRCNPGCGGGQQCINGGCCPLPRCPNGIFAASTCNGGFQCGPGMECANGGCCPFPQCPSGVTASQRCQIGGGCPSGQLCENGMCCPMPVCQNQQVALQMCGMGNACPMGFVCEGRGCCPEPMPLCPNGGRATQKCVRGSECPPGYGCTPLGGCCLLSYEPVCPMNLNPVCQCSPTSACPAQSSCSMGTCCTSAVTTYNQVPGTSCQHNTQCNGYSSSCSSCVQNVCVCVNGATSNGASCQQLSPVVVHQARTGCDQYGSPCRFVISTARRKPLFAPVGNTTETPLWFNVASKRKCVMNSTEPGFDSDSTCLPSEKCINGECKMKLWPGEYGCSEDIECSSRCPNTYCEMRSDKNIPQCQCKNGLLLYGRCFEQCPPGFHESGAYCMHDNEETFWKNADAQDNLKQLLNGGQC